MSAGFTPGPWSLWLDRRDGAFEITAALPGAISGGILVVQRGGMPSRLDMAKANARLIAVAPDMFGALCFAHRHLLDDTFTGDVIDEFFGMAKHAIRKVEGES